MDTYDNPFLEKSNRAEREQARIEQELRRAIIKMEPKIWDRQTDRQKDGKGQIKSCSATKKTLLIVDSQAAQTNL